MLYMIVNTHSAESCAFRSEDDAKALVGAFESFEQEKAAGHGVKILGSWINRPSHEAFILADAPDPHAIDNALVASGAVGRSHTRVVSVLSTDDVQVDTGEREAEATTET